MWGIIGTGQSLSTGGHCLPVINPATRYANLKLGFDYPINAWRSNGTLVYLGEQIRRSSSYAYPYNIQGETPHTSMADQMTALSLQRTGKGDVSLHTVVGKDGWPYALLQKNGVQKGSRPDDPAASGYSFQAAVDEVTEVKRLLTALGKRYEIGAIVVTHGESDYGDEKYDEELLELWSDYNASLKAITGQTASIPFILSQTSAGYPVGSDSLAHAPKSSVAQWRGSVAHPEAMVLAGPKYQYEYFTDNIHLVSASSQRLGIKYAQVYDAIKNGVGWKPLQPKKISVEGNVLRVKMDVPVPPIQFDATLDPRHVAVHTAWQNGRGFEVMEGGSEVVISGVTIVGPDEIEITCASPVSSTARLRYALANDGPDSTRKGQVCDSDPFVGIDAQTLTVDVATGSRTVAVPEGFTHGFRDLAVADGLPAGTIVQGVNSRSVYLLNPWTGATGSATIEFRSDQRNYLVQFDAPVTYP